MSHETLAIAPSTLMSLFGYKACANKELFAVLASLDTVVHPKEAHKAIRILNHDYVVDCIFKAHLVGDTHGYRATNTTETPSLQALTSSVRELDSWYVAYVENLDLSALCEQVRFAFTDGDLGLMSREEILLHVITHGGYHRGAAGQVLDSVAVSPPRDLYTRFLHMFQSERHQ